MHFLFLEIEPGSAEELENCNNNSEHYPGSGNAETPEFTLASNSGLPVSERLSHYYCMQHLRANRFSAF